MTYLYHFVPPDMVGTILYPLNELRDMLPVVYEKHAKKYAGREHVRETVIPGLGTWNDAIHLSPIDPAETRQSLQEAGSSISSSWKVFCINADTLDKSRLMIHVEPEIVGGSGVVNLPFTEENYAEHHHISDRTKAYYKNSIDEGRQVLIYGFAPHVLYGGTIDVSTAEVREYTN